MDEARHLRVMLHDDGTAIFGIPVDLLPVGCRADKRTIEGALRPMLSPLFHGSGTGASFRYLRDRKLISFHTHDRAATDIMMEFAETTGRALRLTLEGSPVEITAWRRQTEHSPSPTQRRKSADRLLTRLESWIPRKYREGLIGDLWEDVREYRADGWTERQIRRLVWREFRIAVVEGVKAKLRSAWFTWVVKAVRGWLAR